MGSLFLQLGQCGCQIGTKLNPLLANSYYCTRKRQPNRLHAIMIDTQPKVLKPITQKNPKWLDNQNIKYFQHGRGNNWSYGYLHQLPQYKKNSQFIINHQQFSHKDNNQIIQKYISENKKISSYCVQKLRRQLQTVDCPMAMNVICSLGGGTGSGIGTRLIQTINEEFNIDVFAHLVLPNMSGQTPLQIYNCSLSLSIIQQHASAIFTIQNEKCVQYFKQISQNIKSQENQKQPKYQSGSLDEINDFIAKNINRMVKINDISNYDQFYNGMINQLVVSPQLKYLSLFGSQTFQKTWDIPFQDLLHQIKIYNKNFNYDSNQNCPVKRQKLISSHLMLIGKEQCDYQQKYYKKLKNILNPIQQIQNLQPIRVSHKGTHISSLLERKENQKKKNLQKNQIMLMINHSNIVRYLSYLVQSGKIKYENKAYLWHYEYANLSEAFQKLQYVIDQYNYFVHQGN